MVIHMLPGWLILLILIGVAGFFLLKWAFYLIAGVVVFFKLLFNPPKIDAHKYHLMYHPEDADKD